MPVAFEHPTFVLSEEQVDGRTRIVTVTGELHVTTAPSFGRELARLLADEPPGLVLDLSGVEYIDSTGLGVLLNCLRRVDRHGGRLALVVTNPTVLRLFQITNMDDTFVICDSRRNALAAIHAAAT